MVVELHWVDLNGRVFYPVKCCLIAMEESGDIDMKDDMMKNAVSSVACKIVDIGVDLYVNTHNHQQIEGGLCYGFRTGDHSSC